MTRRRDPAGVWTVGAVGGALAIAGVLLACRGVGYTGLALAVRMTARWSFLFFWPSYVAGAPAVLFGPAFAGLKRHARSLGLAFAGALLVHVALVVWLGITIGQIPLQGGVLQFFLVALLLTGLLALLSVGTAARSLGRLWRPLIIVSSTYILIAFGRDFVLGALDVTHQNWLYTVEYLPFALLSLIAIPLRLAALLQQRLDARAALSEGGLDREPAIWR